MFGCDSQLHAINKIISNLKDDSNEIQVIFGAVKKTSGQPDPDAVKAANILRVHSMAFINYLLTSRNFVEQVCIDLDNQPMT
jgi:hypothetical protein